MRPFQPKLNSILSIRAMVSAIWDLRSWNTPTTKRAETLGESQNACFLRVCSVPCFVSVSYRVLFQFSNVFHSTIHMLWISGSQLTILSSLLNQHPLGAFLLVLVTFCHPIAYQSDTKSNLLWKQTWWILNQKTQLSLHGRSGIWADRIQVYANLLRACQPKP